MRKRVRTPIRNRSNAKIYGNKTQIKVEKKEGNAPPENLWNLLEEIRPLDLLLCCAPRDVVREQMSENGLRDRDA